MKQPLRSGDPLPVRLMEWDISVEHHRAAILQRQLEPELRDIRRVKVHKFHMAAKDLRSIPVPDRDKLHALRQALHRIREQKFHHACGHTHHVLVEIQLQFPVPAQTPEQPRQAHNMVRVPVGDIDCADVPVIDPCLPHLAQQLTAAARVHQHFPVFVFIDKAGVEAVKDHGVACAEHCDSFHSNPPVFHTPTLYHFLLVSPIIFSRTP